MKKLLVLAIGLCALCVQAQPTNPPLFEVPTNAPPPIQDVENIIKFLSVSTTNWYVATYGIYDADTKSFGGGIGLAYPLNMFMAPTIRFDYINKHLWQPSGTFDLQYPVSLLGGKITVVPFGFGGIATPIGGAGDENGRITEIYGFGMAFSLPNPRKHWWLPRGLVADWERWGNLNGNQYRVGFLW